MQILVYKFGYMKISFYICSVILKTIFLPLGLIPIKNKIGETL